MSPSKPDIVIVGAGNVGYHLGLRLHRAGFLIKQIFSRTVKHGKSLADVVGCSYVTNLREIVPDAEVYLLCVTDDAMRSVVDDLKIHNKIVLHTAGSVSRKISDRIDIHQGVLYPLQSFNRNADVTWEDVPVFIDGDSDATISIATQIAKALSSNVQLANDEQRMAIHIAAVFANNFSNHCMAIGQRLLEEHGYNFSVLKPLIETTFNRLKSTKPFDVQTGPAIRNDATTVEKHLQTLKEFPDWKRLYDLLSNDIIALHKHAKPVD